MSFDDVFDDRNFYKILGILHWLILYCIYAGRCLPSRLFPMVPPALYFDYQLNGFSGSFRLFEKQLGSFGKFIDTSALKDLMSVLLDQNVPEPVALWHPR